MSEIAMSENKAANDRSKNSNGGRQLADFICIRIGQSSDSRISCSIVFQNL